MNILKKIIFVASTLFIFSATSVFAQAAAGAKDVASTVNGPASVMLGESGLSEFSLGAIIAIIIKAALGLLGIIFLVIIIFAGYRWMTSSGNEEEVKKAQEAIKRAIIGLIIVLMAYSITFFVFKQLPFSGSGSGNNPGGGSTGTTTP